MSCLHGWQRHLSAGRDQVLGSSASCLHLDYTTRSTGHQVLSDMPLWRCSGSPLLCAGWCFFSQALQPRNGALCPPHSEFFSHCWKSFRDSRSLCSELPAPGFEQRGHSSCTSCQPVFPLPFSSPSASTILRCLYPHLSQGARFPPLWPEKSFSPKSVMLSLIYHGLITSSSVFTQWSPQRLGSWLAYLYIMGAKHSAWTVRGFPEPLVKQTNERNDQDVYNRQHWRKKVEQRKQD